MSDDKKAPSRFQPTSTEATEPFWEGTRRREYLVLWCTGCGEPIFYPREVCPHCLRDDHLTWRASDGTGTVYSHSVQHRPAWPGLAERVPYVVALIDLDAGDPPEGVDDGGAGDEARRTIRMMANVADVDPDTVTNGDRVTLTWEPLDDGRNLAVFQPAGESER